MSWLDRPAGFISICVFVVPEFVLSQCRVVDNWMVEKELRDSVPSKAPNPTTTNFGCLMESHSPPCSIDPAAFTESPISLKTILIKVSMQAYHIPARRPALVFDKPTALTPVRPLSPGSVLAAGSSRPCPTSKPGTLTERATDPELADDDGGPLPASMRAVEPFPGWISQHDGSIHILKSPRRLLDG